jgi:hypothetical protein
VLVFARAVDGSLASLAKRLDDFVAQNLDKKAKATVVLLVPNRDATAPELEKIAKEQKLAHVPLTIAADGEKGPGEYKIAKGAPVTVVVYQNKKVTASLAFDAIDTKAQRSVLGEFAKILNVDPPKVDDAKQGDSGAKDSGGTKTFH